MNSIKQHSFFLTIIFILSLVIRLIFFNTFLQENPCQLAFDAGHYHELALSLSNGQGIVHADGAPQFYRLPGYSLFLALCYKLFGQSLYAVLRAQIVLASLLPILFFFLSLTLFPGNMLVARVVALVGAVHPGYLIFSGLVMTETLFAIFFTLFLLFFVPRYTHLPSTPALRQAQGERATTDKTPKPGHPELVEGRRALGMSAGLALGLASLIRPVGHFTLCASIVLFFFLSRAPLAHKVRDACVLFLSWFAVVLPWLWRNYALTGYLFFHTLSGVHFLNHVAARLCMEQHDSSYQQAQEIIQSEYAAALQLKRAQAGRPLLDVEESVVAGQIAKNYMLKNPCHSIVHAVRNMVKTTFALYSSELLVIDSGGVLPAYSHKRSVSDLLMRFLKPQLNNKKIYGVIYSEIFLFALMLLGFVGYALLCLLGRVPREPFFITIWFGGLFVGLSLACGYARLRLPAEPLLIIVASYFWCWCWFKIKHRHSG
ncbi:hypothetical protein K2W90_04915 [Candidatus Babeliales bacterium]|nr:hypothetical protein [Candidatus Babeliales bacterium]